QRTADGVDRTVLINARPMELPESRDAAVLITVNDITTHTLADAQVRELNAQLQGKIEQISEANRELEAFSYSVSHDLRAPLRHVAGFADKLSKHLGDARDDKADHYLQVISSSARRMSTLIDDLLVYSRLGRSALRLQNVDLQRLVDDVRAMLMDDCDDRRVIWHIADLPVVIADENMLRLVWQNLLGNAIKYTGHRERAEITIGHSRLDDGSHQFEIRDNGAGFDMEYADKLFGVFQRLHKASEFPGSGIGLANARRILARHGGRIWAEAR